jgi:hypothetical protein
MDDSVITGEIYNYYVIVFDDSYNCSTAFNTAQATAEPRLVSVTFRIGVPAYTPGTVYIVGDIPEFGPWNPGLVPMTQVDSTTWEYTLDILDGTNLQYKFTRGSWETVESWGSIVNINNRSVSIDFGSDGTQLVDMTATDWGSGADSTKAVQYWRDPIVVDHFPADEATGVSVGTQISVTWSIPMQPDTDFVVEGPGGPIAGAFAYDAGSQSVTFTPDSDLMLGAQYTVTVTGAESVGVPGGDSGVQEGSFIWNFATMSPASAIEDLMAEVQALNQAGILNRDQTNALLVKLSGALDKLNQGQEHVAVNRLNAFINQVQAWTNNGLLPAASGQSLIDQAQMIIDAINSG